MGWFGWSERGCEGVAGGGLSDRTDMKGGGSSGWLAATGLGMQRR
jgi:hypothetical protein